MRNIKAKKATQKELEFICKKITKLEPLDFIGILRLCGIALTESYDPETVPEDFKPVARQFEDMFVDFLNYYQNAKKQTRQILINIILGCEKENKKTKNKVKLNGLKSENTETG